MIIYIAGKMGGEPLFNYPLFHETAARLRAQGHAVYNPAEVDGGTPPAGYTFGRPRAYYMRESLKMLLECDAIALLPEWEKSAGAQLEVRIAHDLGMAILDAATLQPVHYKMLDLLAENKQLRRENARVEWQTRISRVA